MLKMSPGYSATFFDDYIWNNFVPADDPLVKIGNFLNLDFIGPLVKEVRQMAARQIVCPHLLPQLLQPGPAGHAKL